MNSHELDLGVYSNFLRQLEHFGQTDTQTDGTGSITMHAAFSGDTNK